MTKDSGEFELLRSRLERDSSGRLVLHGQPMILLPRHFFRYILREVYQAAGPEAFGKIFRKAGHDGAVTFCRRFQEVHGSTPQEAVEGYLKEMSWRGWGQFHMVRLDAAAGYLEVSLRNTALAAEADLPSGNLIWEGAMLGALRFLQESLGSCFDESLRAEGQERRAGDDAAPEFRIVVSRKLNPTGR